MSDISIKKTAWQLLLIALGVVLLFVNSNLAILVLVAIGIYLLSYRLDIGWYALVFLSPLRYWELNLGTFISNEGYGRIISRAHAPMVEFWTIIMLIALAIYLIRQWRRSEKVIFHLPGLHWFLLFVLSAVLSLFNLTAIDISIGIKYIFHFFFLFYFGYIVLGANIVKSKQIWQRSLIVLAIMGFLAALMGFVSLFLGVWSGEGFRRAVPFAIYSWLPFGDQHIFLAETITTALPIFLYFWYQKRQELIGKIWGLSAIFVWLIGMLTLSRAGWLTMLVELIIFLIISKNINSFGQLLKKWWWGIALATPLFLYTLYFTLTSYISRGSTAVRWDLTDVALFFFRQHPIIGSGVGSFFNRANEINYILIEYGTPTDVLGIIQKVMSEQGIIGLITFSLFIGWIIKIIVERYQNTNYHRDARLAYFVSFFLILSPLIFQLFNTNFYTSKMWVPIAIAISQSILFQSDTRPIKNLFNFVLKKKKIETTI